MCLLCVLSGWIACFADSGRRYEELVPEPHRERDNMSWLYCLRQSGLHLGVAKSFIVCFCQFSEPWHPLGQSVRAKKCLLWSMYHRRSDILHVATTIIIMHILFACYYITVYRFTYMYIHILEIWLSQCEKVCIFVVGSLCFGCWYGRCQPGMYGIANCDEYLTTVFTECCIKGSPDCNREEGAFLVTCNRWVFSIADLDLQHLPIILCWWPFKHKMLEIPGSYPWPALVKGCQTYETLSVH